MGADPKFSTTNMYRKPKGRKVGDYFKGKTISPNTRSSAPAETDPPLGAPNAQGQRFKAS